MKFELNNKPFIDPNYRTVSDEINRFKNYDELILDGMLTNVGDFMKINTEWKGSTITLTELEPIEEQVQELCKWTGDKINLNLCGHEYYDLAMFIENMNDWNGNILTIGYSGPKIFTNDVARSFKNPKYKELHFRMCVLPNNFIDLIHSYSPNLYIVNDN